MIVLPEGVDAPASARRFVAERAPDLAADLSEDAQLLVSELVTNATRYGEPDVTLRVWVHPDGIDVAVSDGGDAVVPAVGAVWPAGEQTFGRGLLLVEALASSWGVVLSVPPPGKSVWFELRAGRSDGITSRGDT